MDLMLRNTVIENWKLHVQAIKNCEGSEILPDLQANKLSCHGFMDAHRTLKNTKHKKQTNKKSTLARDKGHYYSQEVE